MTIFNASLIYQTKKFLLKKLIKQETKVWTSIIFNSNSLKYFSDFNHFFDMTILTG